MLSLDQILAGYHRLHRVVVELLEADATLPRDLRFYLEDAFHGAERQAVSAYVEWESQRRRELDQSALQERTDELTRTSARMNQFLAMIAHELRTPLSAISNALYVLENLSLPEKADRQVTRASRQAHQAARLISDLLDFSRITRGKIELRTEQISLRRVAADAVESMRPLFDSHGHHVTTRYDSDPLPINADPTRVEQIISNLLTNAAKYTEPGGQIDVFLQREGDTAILRVRDSGIGIDPDKLPHIFNLYEQFGLSEARSHGGLGIGLSLVKLLVGLHGGAVGARSEGVGQGSEFEVRFPLVVPGAPAERVPPQGVPEQAGRRAPISFTPGTG